MPARQNETEKRSSDKPERRPVEAENAVPDYSWGSVPLAVQIILPLAIITLILGRRGIGIRPYPILDTYVSLICPSFNQRQRLLKWMSGRIPHTNSLSTKITQYWKDGSLLCTLINTVVPGACPNPQRHWKQPPTHGQALAFKYLGVAPVLTENDFQETSLSFHLERIFVKYLLTIQEAINKLDVKEDINVKYTSRYIARGMGLVTGEQNRTSVFFIYPNARQKKLENILIHVKGPFNTFGTHTLSAESISKTCKTMQSVQKNVRREQKKLAFQSPAQRSFFRSLSIDLGSFASVLANRKSSGDIALKIEMEEGRTKISFVPKHSGIYELNLTADGAHLAGSPYNIRVAKNESDVVDTLETNGKSPTNKTSRIISKCIDFINESIDITNNNVKCFNTASAEKVQPVLDSHRIDGEESTTSGTDLYHSEEDSGIFDIQENTSSSDSSIAMKQGTFADRIQSLTILDTEEEFGKNVGTKRKNNVELENVSQGRAKANALDFPKIPENKITQSECHMDRPANCNISERIGNEFSNSEIERNISNDELNLEENNLQTFNSASDVQTNYNCCDSAIYDDPKHTASTFESALETKLKNFDLSPQELCTENSSVMSPSEALDNVCHLIDTTVVPNNNDDEKSDLEENVRHVANLLEEQVLMNGKFLYNQKEILPTHEETHNVTAKSRNHKMRNNEKSINVENSEFGDHLDNVNLEQAEIKDAKMKTEELLGSEIFDNLDLKGNQEFEDLYDKYINIEHANEDQLKSRDITVSNDANKKVSSSFVSSAAFDAAVQQEKSIKLQLAGTEMINIQEVEMSKKVSKICTIRQIFENDSPIAPLDAKARASPDLVICHAKSWPPVKTADRKDFSVSSKVDNFTKAAIPNSNQFLTPASPVSRDIEQEVKQLNVAKDSTHPVQDGALSLLEKRKLLRRDDGLDMATDEFVNISEIRGKFENTIKANTQPERAASLVTKRNAFNKLASKFDNSQNCEIDLLKDTNRSLALSLPNLIISNVSKLEINDCDANSLESINSDEDTYVPNIREKCQFWDNLIRQSTMNLVTSTSDFGSYDSMNSKFCSSVSLGKQHDNKKVSNMREMSKSTNSLRHSVKSDKPTLIRKHQSIDEFVFPSVRERKDVYLNNTVAKVNNYEQINKLKAKVANAVEKPKAEIPKETEEANGYKEMGSIHDRIRIFEKGFHSIKQTTVSKKNEENLSTGIDIESHEESREKGIDLTSPTIYSPNKNPRNEGIGLPTPTVYDQIEENIDFADLMRQRFESSRQYFKSLETLPTTTENITRRHSLDDGIPTIRRRSVKVSDRFSLDNLYKDVMSEKMRNCSIKGSPNRSAVVETLASISSTGSNFDKENLEDGDLDLRYFNVRKKPRERKSVRSLFDVNY